MRRGSEAGHHTEMGHARRPPTATHRLEHRQVLEDRISEDQYGNPQRSRVRVAGPKGSQRSVLVHVDGRGRVLDVSGQEIFPATKLPRSDGLVCNDGVFLIDDGPAERRGIFVTPLR